MELSGREFAGPFSLDDPSIPQAGGVYIIAGGDTDDFVPLYIGTSHNVRARLMQHIDSGAVSRSIKDISSLSVYFCEIESPAEARFVERELIFKYKPPLNLVHLKEMRKRYEEAKRVDVTRRFSSIVAGTSATIAIAIAVSMLFGVVFDEGQALTRKELTERIALIDSSLEETRQAIAQTQSDMNRIEAEMDRMVSLPENSKWASEATRINEKIVAVNGKLAALESALTVDPAKALAVPILRKDLDNTREAFKSDLAQARSEIAQVYDLNKWFIGLMITIAISVLGLAFSSFIGRKDS